MRVVLRWRDGWWHAYVQGYTMSFADDTSFERLVCDLIEYGCRIIAVERRKYATPYPEGG